VYGVSFISCEFARVRTFVEKIGEIIGRIPKPPEGPLHLLHVDCYFNSHVLLVDSGLWRSSTVCNLQTLFWL
jgi:hypothetical protein